MTLTPHPGEALLNDNAHTDTPPLQLIAAPFTPFNPAGKIQPEKVLPIAQALARQGVCGVFVNGTSGEGLSLSQDERKVLVEAWQEAAKAHELQLMVHVGHSSVEEARDLASHAESVGVDAVASLGPVFFPASTVNSLVSYCGRIASAAPNTPFYYYHMPSMTRVGVNASQALPPMTRSIPTFGGIKFTHEDIDDYRLCLETSSFPVFFGRDELLLEGIRAGARSAVGSTYNFAAPLYLELADAHAKGDSGRAEDLQALCTEAIRILVSFGGLPAIKACMTCSGVDCGPVRDPLETLSGVEIDKLHNALDKLHFFSRLEEVKLARQSASLALSSSPAGKHRETARRKSIS